MGGGEETASLEDIVERQKELLGPVTRARELTGRETVRDIIEHGLPAFGGKHLRTAYRLMRQAIIEGHTIFYSLAGPITASGYSNVWVNSFMRAGYISAFVASDAISYHDMHDAVIGKRAVHDVNMNGDDVAYREAQIIRITDIGFPESVLFDTDKFSTWVFTQPEFQRKLTTTEYRWQLGRHVHALEKQRGLAHGLLATAYEYDVPGFCASPADGSTFLNVMKLKLLSDMGKLSTPFNLEIDLPTDVLEFCAYHLWSQEKEGNGKLAYTVCGGGASKNYMLQPEPALSQILFIDTGMYDIGVQFTTAPVTDGSLSSCPPTEAVSWGKLSKESRTVSVPMDYTQAMSFIASAILHERDQWQSKLQHTYDGDRERLFIRHPEAKGFLREPARLYTKRTEALAFLREAASSKIDAMLQTIEPST
jgi:deoxyhypusine synthase